MNRRNTLKSLFIAGASLFSPIAFSQNKESKTRLILLGTKGGPRVGGVRANPSTLILINDVPYVVDCGYGVSEQLVKVGIPLQNIKNIFFTHMHSDHNLEFGGLIYNAWATGLKQQIDVYGMVPLKKMTRSFLDAMQFDIDTRIADEGKPDLRKLILTHEFTKSGVILKNADVTVTVARVRHPPIKEAYAYRFDTASKSIVISGDTNYSPELIALAKGADVLVHEALYVPKVQELAYRIPNAKTLLKHLLASHTSTEDVGRVAQEAGVKKLVLSHLVPGDDTSITDEMWMEGVKKFYQGEVVVGRDLMEIQ